jgi:NAD dependent epimerase/dehydratase family enzyme
VPGPVLRIALGEVADVLLGGQHTVPKKLQDAGYKFRFENAADALADLFG